MIQINFEKLVDKKDRLIHEPARLMIMSILNGVGEADFLYLQREGEFTQGSLSSHFSELEEASYVSKKPGFPASRSEIFASPPSPCGRISS